MEPRGEDRYIFNPANPESKHRIPRILTLEATTLVPGDRPTPRRG